MDGTGKEKEREQGESEEQSMEDPPLIEDMSIITFKGHSINNSVYCTSINPTNPQMVATGGGDDIGFLWNIQTGEKYCSLEGHSDSIADIQFNHDGKLLATA